MEGVTVIGFLPREGSSAIAAAMALDAASERLGATPIRRWRGERQVHYTVLAGLEDASAVTAPEVEIHGRGRLSVDAAFELPATLHGDIDLVAPVNYGEVLVCTCGGLDGAHRPGCERFR